MNVLKTSLIPFFLVAGAASAQDQPRFADGTLFKITLIENLDYLVNVDDDATNPVPLDKISGYMVDMIRDVAEKANFAYELYLPSGFGPNCNPGAIEATGEAYDPVYRPQFNCGQDDVVDRASVPTDFQTDMYWSLYYITNPRMLLNRFSLPYIPPRLGALTMYGTATGVKDFEDLIQQQAAGKQGPACVGSGTAYANYLAGAFPDLKTVPVTNDDAGCFGGLQDGTCEICVNAYPYATDFVGQRVVQGQCNVNGKPIGIIGDSLGFGLSQFGIGIANDLNDSVAVTDTIDYWLNALMTCAPGAPDSVCQESGSLYESYGTYGPFSGDGSDCGYVANPTTEILSSGAIAGIAIGSAVAILIAVCVWYGYRTRKQEARYKKRFVQQVARNISIAPTPGAAISADKLAAEMKLIGDKNGKIGKSALRNWMNDGKLGQVSDSDFDALWRAIDVDGSGTVDVIEFCVFLSACGDAFDEVYKVQKSMNKKKKAAYASRRLSGISRGVPVEDANRPGGRQVPEQPASA